MALLNNDYIKIIGVENNFINNSSIIHCALYKSIGEREREKELRDKVTEFITKAGDYVYTLEEALQQKYIHAIDPNTVSETVFKAYIESNESLKQEYNTFQEISKEYYYLYNQLLNNIIDWSTLQYTDIWQQLGLLESMCIPIEIVYISLGFEEVFTDTDRSTLYTKLKTKIENTTDC